MSVAFKGGPAEGVCLELRRTPVMLRVVQSAAGKWDALDELADEPRRGESVHIYRREGEPSFGFIDFRRNGRREGRRCAFASYVYWPDQPGDAHTRDNEAWRAWCDALQEREEARNA